VDSRIAGGSAATDQVPHTSDRVAGWKGEIYITIAHLSPAGWKVQRDLFSVLAALPRHWPCSSAAQRDREGKRKREMFLFFFTTIFHLLCSCSQLVTFYIVRWSLLLFVKVGANC